MSKKEEKNDVAIIRDTVTEINAMVKSSVEYQAKASPIYSEISSKILKMLNKQEELNHWEVKDLLKLLDLSNKAQFQPVEQLTKLVQSVEALYEKSELREKIDELGKVVNEAKQARKESSNDNDNDNSIIDIDDLEKITKK